MPHSRDVHTVVHIVWAGASSYVQGGCKTCSQAATVSWLRHEVVCVQRPTSGSRGSTSIGCVDKDECSPLHNGSAGANEGDMDIFDLVFPSPS